MPKSIELKVQVVNIEVIETSEGMIFVIDGIATRGKDQRTLRAFLDHASWLKISCALSKKGI